MGLWSAVWTLTVMALVIVAAAMVRRVRTGPRIVGALSAQWVSPSSAAIRTITGLDRLRKAPPSRAYCFSYTWY